MMKKLKMTKEAKKIYKMAKYRSRSKSPLIDKATLSLLKSRGLDINFFEKCLFGRKLTERDKLIFGVYACEILDIIRADLAKHI